MRVKNIAIIIAAVFMTVMLILYPENSLQSALHGLELWGKTVLPSLLPFVVASFILMQTGIVSLISGFFAPIMRFLFNTPGQSAYVLIASSLSGYPVGARLTGELYKNGDISEPDASKILRFTSVSGPVFITGAVSTGMLGIPEAGVYLAGAHYLSAVLTGIIFGIFSKRNKKDIKKTSVKQNFYDFKNSLSRTRSFGDIMTDSVTKAIKTMLKVGGFIIFFSVVAEVLSVLGVWNFLMNILAPNSTVQAESSPVYSLLIGSVELTGGCYHTSSLTIPINLKLSVISFIIAFGGFCVHMQTRAVCQGVKPKMFLLAKLLQGVLAYGLCMASLKLWPLTVSVSTFAKQTNTAAYLGVCFAAVSIIVLVIVKLLQKRYFLRFPDN